MWETLCRWKEQNPKEYKITIMKVYLMIFIPSIILGIIIGKYL